MHRKNRQALRWMVIRVACLALCLSVSGVAQAELVTFKFEGTVQDFRPSPVNPPIVSGTRINGFYTFESTTPDRATLGDPSHVIGSYALSNFSVTLPERTYSMATHSLPNEIRVENQSFSDAYRVLLIPSGIEQAITGPSINNLVPRSFQFNIFGDLFTSDARDTLPLKPPSIGSLGGNSRQFIMFFSGGGVGATINGTLDSLTAVPLPGALLLFGSGLLGLMGISVGRRVMAQPNHCRADS